MLRVLTTESTETQRGCSCSLNLCVSVPSVVKNTQPRHHSCGSCYSDAKKSLKLTGVISPPQELCTAVNWVFISDPPSPIGLKRTGRRGRPFSRSIGLFVGLKPELQTVALPGHN